MDKYYDAVTGEEIPESELTAADTIVPEAGWGSSYAQSVLKAPSHVMDVFGGVSGTLAEWTNSDYLRSVADTYQGHSDQWRNSVSNFFDNAQPAPGSIPSYFEPVANFGTDVAATLATGGLAGAATIGGAIGMGSTYDSLERSGVDPNDAANAAAVSGIVNAGFSALPVKPLVRGQVGRGIATITGQNVAQDLSTMGATDALVPNYDPSPKQYAGAALQSAVVGGAIGVPVGLAHMQPKGYDLQQIDASKIPIDVNAIPVEPVAGAVPLDAASAASTPNLEIPAYKRDPNSKVEMLKTLRPGEPQMVADGQVIYGDARPAQALLEGKVDDPNVIYADAPPPQPQQALLEGRVEGAPIYGDAPPQQKLLPGRVDDPNVIYADGPQPQLALPAPPKMEAPLGIPGRHVGQQRIDYDGEVAYVEPERLSFRSILRDQSGSAPILSSGAQAAANITKRIYGGMTSIGKRSNDPDFVDIPEFDKAMNAPVIGFLRRQIKPILVQAEQWGDKPGSEGLKVAADGFIARHEASHGIQFDAADKLAPLLSLSKEDKAFVSKLSNAIFDRDYDARLKGTGRVPVLTDQALKGMGANDKQIAGYRAMRDYMNNDALDLMRQGLRNKVAEINNDGTITVSPEASEAIDKWILGMKDNYHYMPRGREGSYFVSVRDANNKLVDYPFVDSKAEAQKLKDKLKAEYGQGYTVQFGRVENTQDAVYRDMPQNVANALKTLNQPGGAGFSQPGVDPLGALAHMVKSRNIKGYDDDAVTQLQKYVRGVANFVGGSELDIRLRKAKKLSPKKSIGYGAYEAIDRMERLARADKHGVQAKIDQLATSFYLGGKASAAVLDLSQPLTTTVALSGKYLGGVMPEVVGLKAYGKVGSYLASPEKFAANNPDLFQKLETLKRNGWLDNGTLEEFQTNNTKLDNTARVLMAGKAASEKINKTHAAIVAYDIIRRGKSGVAPDQYIPFMRDFVNDTQFIQAKWARAPIWQGNLSTSGLFKQWSLNWLRLLAKNKDDYRVWSRMLGYQASIAGVVGLPFVGGTLKALEALGYDSTKSLGEAVSDDPYDETARAVLYGMPTLAGVNTSGALGTGDPFNLLGNTKMSVVEAFGKLGLGPVADLYYRPKEAYDMYKSGQPLSRAIEPLMPVSVGSAMAGIRASGDEGFTTKKGATVYRNPTGLDIALKAGGFQPEELSRQYAIMGDQYRAQQAYEDARGNYNEQFAKAILNRDKQQARAVMEAGVEKMRAVSEKIGTPFNEAKYRSEMIKSVDYYAKKSQPSGQFANAPKAVRQSQEFRELEARRLNK